MQIWLNQRATRCGASSFTPAQRSLFTVKDLPAFLFSPNVCLKNWATDAIFSMLAPDGLTLESTLVEHEIVRRLAPNNVNNALLGPGNFRFATRRIGAVRGLRCG